MLKDIYPFGMVASLLRQPIGVFYFMKTIYTTQTRVEGKHCIIEIYKDLEWWHTYDFHLNLLFYDRFGNNIYNQLGYKWWGTTENIAEIHNAIMKHLLSR